MAQIAAASPFEAIRSHTHGESAGVEIAEISAHGYYNLRCDATSAEVAALCREALGVALPAANRVARHADVAVYWLGPDEWLVTDGGEGSLVDRLSNGLQDRFHALTELTGAMAALRMTGDDTEAVLRQGTTLDIHPRVFAVDHCAQTVMAKTSVLLARDPSGFEVMVRRSFADYLLRFLLDAAHQCGYRYVAAEA